MNLNAPEREAILKCVARLLKDERLKRDLSMTRLAEKAGLSQQMISFVERGMRQPTLDTLLRICAAMDIRLSELIERAESARKANR